MTVSKPKAATAKASATQAGCGAISPSQVWDRAASALKWLQACLAETSSMAVTRGRAIHQPPTTPKTNSRSPRYRCKLLAPSLQDAAKPPRRPSIRDVETASVEPRSIDELDLRAQLATARRVRVADRNSGESCGDAETQRAVEIRHQSAIKLPPSGLRHKVVEEGRAMIAATATKAAGKESHDSPCTAPVAGREGVAAVTIRGRPQGAEGR